MQFERILHPRLSRKRAATVDVILCETVDGDESSNERRGNVQRDESIAHSDRIIVGS